MNKQLDQSRWTCYTITGFSAAFFLAIASRSSFDGFFFTTTLIMFTTSLVMNGTFSIAYIISVEAGYSEETTAKHMATKSGKRLSNIGQIAFASALVSLIFSYSISSGIVALIVGLFMLITLGKFISGCNEDDKNDYGKRIKKSNI